MVLIPFVMTPPQLCKYCSLWGLCPSWFCSPSKHTAVGENASTHYIFNSYLVFYGIFMLGGVLCFVGTLFVSCFKLFIDLYLWVIHWYMSLFVYCLKSRSYFVYLYCFHTCDYAFCLVLQEIYRLIQLSCCLHLQLMDSS